MSSHERDNSSVTIEENLNHDFSENISSNEEKIINQNEQKVINFFYNYFTVLFYLLDCRIKTKNH